jgi:hypothetical protein
MYVANCDLNILKIKENDGNLWYELGKEGRYEYQGHTYSPVNIVSFRDLIVY